VATRSTLIPAASFEAAATRSFGVGAGLAVAFGVSAAFAVAFGVSAAFAGAAFAGLAAACAAFRLAVAWAFGVEAVAFAAARRSFAFAARSTFWFALWASRASFSTRAAFAAVRIAARPWGVLSVPALT
jgi:hypothetical protein